MTDPQPGIAAKYPSTCHRCDEPINVGDRIAYVRGRAIHARCMNGADE